jgi:hypothetical protein
MTQQELLLDVIESADALAHAIAHSNPNLAIKAADQMQELLDEIRECSVAELLRC